MSEMTQSDFIFVATAWIKEHGLVSSSLVNDGEITEHTDLIATGLLDSQGFIELLLFLEAQSGMKIDLTDVQPDEFSTVGGLSRIVLGNHGRSHEHAHIA